jgi:3-oxoacyl-[acyl-carrier protein] reductase
VDFTNQVAIVTGGTGSIGREVVLGLARRGAQVLFCYRANAEAARELEAACNELPGASVGLAADVRDQAAMNGLVDAALQRWGRLDIVVTAASTISNAPVEEMSLEQWNAVLDTVLRGVTRICRAALRPMQKARYGRIVTVTGYQALAGALTQANYAAAMGGVLGFGRALAREVAAWGITINSVAPGLLDRPQLAAFDQRYIPWATNIVPLKRLGLPAEVVPAVLMLASRESAYMSGDTIIVDGGWRMV